jgi:predicted ATPase/DNA-binding CsgD family transcriptional regulator
MSSQEMKGWDAEVDWGEPVYLRSSFFGRQNDLAALSAMLADPAVRLVTITGPSGVGKSRIAAQLYVDSRELFPDGVVFVSLSSVRDPELVLNLLAKALELREDRDTPVLDRLQERLDGKRMLLVLDGFEHVLSASRAITELLTRASGPVVLVTSRAPLRITAEHEYLLAPLKLPPADGDRSPETLMQNTAVALFVDRARAVRNTFELTSENAEAVAEVCRRLDGLPLAIELAAARTKILSPQALLSRLSNRLQLLTGGPRDVPARLQTMRDAIAWSYDLLAPEHKAVFRHISVFSGGFNLDEASAIEGFSDEGDPFAPGDGGDPLELFDAIASLVDSSMVLADRSSESEARFIILETMREYGLEQLEEAGEAEIYRRRHAFAFLRLAEMTDQYIWGPEAYRWVHRLDQENGNLRSAMEWAIANDPKLALRLAGKLWWYWQTRGYLTEGRSWLRRSLEAAPYEPSDDRLQALFGGGFLAGMQGDPLAAEPYLEQCRRVVAESEEAGREGQVEFLESFVLGSRGDHEAAVASARSALEQMTSTGAEARIPFAHNRLGIELAAIGQHEESEAHFRAALERWQVRGNEWGVVTALINLAIAARNKGDYAQAVTDLVNCLEPAHRQGDPWGEAETRLTLAGLAAILGDNIAATRFHASAEKIRKTIGLSLQEYIDPALLDGDKLQERLADPAYAAAWAEGQVATMDQLMTWAQELQELARSGRRAAPQPSPAPKPMPAASRFPVSQGILSPRELEVLRLMAEGLSSREIGERLFISPRTATTHVANIFAKLDVDSRASAVTAGFRLGLI